MFWGQSTPEAVFCVGGTCSTLFLLHALHKWQLGFFFFFLSFCIFCPEFSLTEHESSYFSSPTSPLCFETDAEAEAPILCLPSVKNLLVVKDPDAGKD